MISVEGIEQVKQQFGAARFNAATRAATFATGQEIKNYLQDYPKETASNRPGRIGRDGRPMGYYERGRGWWSPIIKRENLRSFGNFGKSKGLLKARGAQAKAGIVAGYRLTSTSERLREKWTVEREGLGAIVKNAATYGAPVQGDPQVAFFKAIGWRGVQDAIKYVNNSKTFETAFFMALKNKLGGV